MNEPPKGKRVAANEEWLQIRIPRGVKERLQSWAAKKELSASYIVRRLILEALEQGRDERGDIP